MKVRGEGVRVRHRPYSAHGDVPRPEATLNAPGQFRVFRHKTGEEEGPMQRRQLRAGIAGGFDRRGLRAFPTEWTSHFRQPPN
jgi:hypothetical protein